MIEVRMLIDSIDYDSVAEMLVPLLAENLEQKGGLMGKLAGSKKEFVTNAARKMLGKMSQEKKDEMVVDLLNKKHEMLIEKLSDLATSKGVKAKIRSISVNKY